MSTIFFITVSGLRRTPKKTCDFLNNAERLMQIKNIGIDLRNIERDTLVKSYDLSLAEFISGGELSPGEIGCLLSHQKVYKVISSENIDWALVIEDDAEMLVDAKVLICMSQKWFNSGYELVHLSPFLGGVVLNEQKDKSGKALVPPLTTCAYWISTKGARKLQTKKSIIGGLADWPIQVANLQMRSVFTPIACSGPGNSTIETVYNHSARTRESLSYRPIAKIISLSNLKLLFKAISVYGLITVLKFSLFYRMYKRLARFFKLTQKGQNKTSFFISV
jgi:GR25 family glycosyltransferase involved in LPS biosynthesis